MMAEKSSFFNSVNGDRKYLAGDFAEFFSPLITNGFFPGDLNLKVVADANNMTVKVKPGRAWINGYMYNNTSDLTLTHDVAHGSLARIDRVVVQLSFINRNIRAIIKKGTAASSPVPPQLQRDADIYELGIATVTINAGATSIVQANITDTRADVTVGGIVNNLFADANAQADNVMLDDLNNYYVSGNVEGALIELAQPLSVYKTNEDVNGIFTNILWKNAAGINVKRSVLSNLDAEGNYLRRTVTLFAANGSTVMKTIVYNLTYNAEGVVISEVVS